MTPGHAGAPRRHRGAGDLGPCQDLSTSYESGFRHVGCPALVLHGGGDLNMPANDALTAYRALRAAGNHDGQQAVFPRLDHYFPLRPGQRLWAQ